MFILISAALAATNRLISGLGQAVNSHYTMYSLTFIAVLFFEYGELPKGGAKQLTVFAVLACTAWSYGAYSWYKAAPDRNSCLNSISKLHSLPDGSFTDIADHAKHVKTSEQTLQACKKLGIYVPPEK